MDAEKVARNTIGIALSQNLTHSTRLDIVGIPLWFMHVHEQCQTVEMIDENQVL